MNANIKNTSMVLFPLNKRRILKKTIEGSVIWFIIFFVLFFIPSLYSYLINFDIKEILMAMLSFTFFISIIFFLNYYYQKWYFYTYFYDSTGEYITIRKNPFSLKTKTIFYDKITDVSIHQSFLDKKFNLYDIHLVVEDLKREKIKISGFEKETVNSFLDFIVRSQSFRLKKNNNIM